MKAISYSATMIVFCSMLFIPILVAQTNWTHVTDKPVLKCGAAGAWDDGCTCMPIVVKEGDTLKMWYTGVDGAMLQGRWRKGFAWSLDGVHWEKHAGNPIKLSFELEIIIKAGNTYEGWGRIDKKLYFTTSFNGIDWTTPVATDLQNGKPDDWDGADWIFRAGPVVKDTTGYKMWYMGTQGQITQIGLATSTDGIHWIKYDDPATTNTPFAHSDPVLKVGRSSDWDAAAVFDHWVMPGEKGYEMWYSGISYAYAIGYATSADGISWTKWSGNPIMKTNPKWGTGYVTCCALKFDNRYHLWFASFYKSEHSEIGYVVSDIGTDVKTGEAGSKTPEEFRLEQNYPNPFNAGTTIHYQIPNPCHVTLRILNIMGQEIVRLVDKQQQSGYNVVNWNVSQVSSGVYFYELTAQDDNFVKFSEINKMLLMK